MRGRPVSEASNVAASQKELLIARLLDDVNRARQAFDSAKLKFDQAAAGTPYWVRARALLKNQTG